MKRVNSKPQIRQGNQQVNNHNNVNGLNSSAIIILYSKKRERYAVYKGHTQKAKTLKT